MNNIKIKCPAKINLTLEIVNKREDGFHNIKSIMQTASLYDYLTIQTELSKETQIILSGSSKEIPYNEKNLVYKAAELYLKETNINAKVSIYIEKNIPVSAGLAGGSTDASGTLYGLNEIFEGKLSKEEIHALASKLGSDLNVCLEGGCILATSRGEVIQKIDADMNYTLTLIKPKTLGISAKEAYTKYSLKEFKPNYNKTESMLEAIKLNNDIKEFLYNDLEYAVFDDYTELQEIKKACPDAIMSGSGSTYFVLGNGVNNELGVNEISQSEDFQIFENLVFTKKGVQIG